MVDLTTCSLHFTMVAASTVVIKIYLYDGIVYLNVTGYVRWCNTGQSTRHKPCTVTVMVQESWPLGIFRVTLYVPWYDFWAALQIRSTSSCVVSNLIRSSGNTCLTPC